MSYSITLLENKLLESIFTLNLKVYTGTDSVSKNTVEEVIELLQVMPGIELIVCSDHIGDKEVGKELFNYIKEQSLNIPVVIMGSPKRYDKAGDFDSMGTLIPISSDIKTFVRACARHLGITSKDMASKIVPEYMPIQLHYFGYMRKMPCDIFQKETQSENPFSFFLKKHSFLEKEAYSQLENEGIKNLYIEATQRIHFVNSYTAQVIGLAVESALKEGRDDIMESAFTLIYEQLRDIGVGEDVMELADLATEAVIKNVARQKEFRGFLSRLLSNTNSYMYQHMQVIAYLTFHIVDKIDWGKSEHQEKLAYASIFHDVALGSDDLVKIHSTHELEKAEISDKMREVVKNHAALGAQIIRRIPNAPYEADAIIMQHHGSKTGVGFPDKAANDLSRLSALFFISHEYADNLLKDDDDETKLDHKNLIFKLHESYPSSSYQNIIKTLAWLLVEKEDGI